ncbi:MULTISPECIES: SDR family oxidoreductase [unclassified Gilliamella]|uniref:SDR family oxidoreductase n=1 Tax=unclassified Gilliamella TaxID=2685620 RepID=UPI001C6A7F31|nr:MULTISPECIES: SDR family oxidoreductase [unclassified Gilliamella]MCX8600653.1 SDR family oxidoreductase [Gilliamella sp. B3722]MCX8609193.1 SDR family oxidoreductase [Gilliamella sp. B3771]MCX8609870.1 SDR family oxidoreductase [Gilliamella sp. B3891]MCX8612040.1 SDR family oxidoreductase [Gilliamella sp. B3773]MCX8615544.1 SDR family oxidoreductase [Gilliamella sp. B3770]
MTEQTYDPTKKYHHTKFPKQKQTPPGLQCEMKPIPDCGEKSYHGHGRLAGRKMLVTGGDSGIGRAAAIAYAKEGADVAINYLPYEEKDAKEVAKVIESVGRKAVLIPGDLSDEDFCKKLVKQAHTKLGGLDNLTLVAGKQTAVEDIMKLTTEQVKKTFEINVFSLFWVTKAALGYLKPGSTIITTSSVQAFQPSANLLDYASTKSAIIAFTRGLAKQLGSKGIRVNCVAPGPVWTPLQVCGGQPSDVIPEFGMQTPLKRAGQPVELAGVYVHLASEESSYTTAETYGVTGGMHTN